MTILKDIPNYPSIKDVLLSDKDLNGDQMNQFLSVAMEFSSHLINNSNFSHELGQQSLEVQGYIKEVVLFRMTRMYDRATKENVNEADSLTLFTNLRDTVCTRLQLSVDLLPKVRMNSILKQGLKSFFDEEPSIAVTKNMELISKIASQVVPDVPVKPFEGPVHILD